MSKLVKVKFKDGTYGIRVDYLFCKSEYLDIVNPHHYWRPSSVYFGDCRASEEVVDSIFNKLTDPGTPV